MPLFAAAIAAAVTVVAAIVPAIDLSGRPTAPRPEFPAPAGYLLPWAGGQIHAVTQGEETTLTHNVAAAYAFDFDLSYETVVAARSGTVALVRQDSNAGGCNAAFTSSGNFVVIDHGDGTSALYLHLAFDSVLVNAGDIVVQGQPIAVSGETGLTCSDDRAAPGAHLHFQVERTETNHYFTQSLPVAFDDVPSSQGVPQEGRAYMSGNYGRGRQQRIRLTPWRMPREFNPVARPADPGLLEAEHVAVPSQVEAPPSPAGAEAEGADTPQAADVTPEATYTPRPTRTPAPTSTPTQPAVTETPLPQPTATRTPTPEAVPPAPTDTPSPSPTVQATGGAGPAVATDTATP